MELDEFRDTTHTAVADRLLTDVLQIERHRCSFLGPYDALPTYHHKARSFSGTYTSP
jgi:hypothetical protein